VTLSGLARAQLTVTVRCRTQHSEIEMPRAADSDVESSEVESNGTADY